MTHPGVAVVVATHDRPAGLGRLLEALAGQFLAPAEVVVVDDASTPAAATVVEAFADRLPVTLLRNQRALGPGRARNHGWRQATAEYVAFTDDDCRPGHTWLSELLAAAAPDRVVVGRVGPDPADGPVGSVLDRTMRVDSEDGRFSTCNVLYPRGLLERLGGFDEAFDLYGEDTDLGQRALALGAHGHFAERAVVHHAVHRQSLAAALRERRRVGEMARLLRRHPQLRRGPYVDGMWLSLDQRYFAQALAGLLFAKRFPPAALWTLRYLRYGWRVRLQEWPRDRSPQGLARLALLDAADMASCLQASVRHRTLVL